MTLLIAHRGASGEAPENTLAAFQRAIELKSDFVELDIQFYRAGKAVVIHDETVERTTNGRGRIAEMSLEEIRKLDAGSWFGAHFAGEKIPTLEDVIELVKPSSTQLLIEIKKGKDLPVGFAKTLVQVTRTHQMISRVIVQSFDHEAVQLVKTAEPSITTAAVIDYRSPDPVSQVKAAGAEILAIKWTLTTRNIVESAHQNGVRVFVWTVNQTENLQKMLALRVDGIITNYPARFKRHC